MKSRPRHAGTLFYLSLALLFACPAATAEQAIDIHFSKDPASGQEAIKAQTAYRKHGKALRRVLTGFQHYADLHPWVTDVKTDHQPLIGKTAFVIRFKFPWPIGRRWSRVEISIDSADTISWRQTEGSMHANRGQLQFSGSGDRIEVDYTAVISVGIPGPWTRVFKKRFIREFIAAAYSKASDSSSGFILADTSAQ